MNHQRPSSSSSNSSTSSSPSTQNDLKFAEVLLVHIPPPVPNPKFEALPPRKIFSQRRARYPEEVDRDDYYVDAMLRLLENAGKIDENFAIRNYQ
uniref:Uncharacterized protein n=2 Tax=Bursaphelenchus xylophilus TaxID=6326 RepID=A0A1I7SP22_BURXY